VTLAEISNSDRKFERTVESNLLRVNGPRSNNCDRHGRSVEDPLNGRAGPRRTIEALAVLSVATCSTRTPSRSTSTSGYAGTLTLGVEQG
jgi:hypothetical protein